jgi:GH15 family glucan-1,4-alpha-glucosidase
MKRLPRVALLVLIILASPAAAQSRSWNYLTSGNGYGFQVFDTNAHKITSFLEHPYRYLGPNPSDPHAEGVLRRNLAYDFYFGVRGGGSAGWLNAPTVAGDTSYLDQSHIIESPATLGTIATESYFFAPFDYPGNAMVALLKAPGASDGFVLFNFHLGSGSGEAPGSDGESLRYLAASKAVVETGPGGGFMVYVPLSGVAHADCNGAYAKVIAGSDLGDATGCSGNDVVPAFQAPLDSDGWMAVAVAFVDSSNPADADAAAASLAAWAKARKPAQLLADARAEFEAWRKAPPASLPLCNDAERQLWRQSETVLRMAQIREPNTATRHNNGMILASLPPGMWHTAWVRDATYAIVALARSGHFAEAKAGLDFMLDAQPVGSYASYVQNQSYRISLTRYFGNGQEECDWASNGPNTEMDGWGLMLWAARQYVEASGDSAWLTSLSGFGAVYDVLQSGVAAPLEANLETTAPNQSIVRADSSIWEVHQPGKHYAYTTMAAARGLCDFAALAQTNGKASDVTHYATLAAKVKSAFWSRFADPQLALGGSVEGLAAHRYYDGALAEAFNLDLLPDYSGPMASATLTMFNHLRVASGGYKRNDDNGSSYDNNEWIFVDLRVSDSLRRAGHVADADRFLGQVVQQAAGNFFLLPELYNASAGDGPIGMYAGSIPMVGYGAGTFMMVLMDRSGAWEPNDCGDGKRTNGVAYQCPALLPDGGAGGGGGPSDGGTAGGGSGSAGSGGGSGSSNGGGTGGGGKTASHGACVCNVSGRGPTSGTMTLLALPWLLVGMRLCGKSRCK